jgi:predicted ATP-dependent endonuclease of OLD family
MHPQMQQVFIGYLEKFLQKISKIKVQTVITTHSSHIAKF